MGYRAIIFYGHPDYYPRFGFQRAERYGITSSDGCSFDALMAMELYDGALDGVNGCYFEDAVYDVDPDEMAAFEKNFPPREPVQLPPIETLIENLPGCMDCINRIRNTFSQQGIRYVPSLQKFSGAEMLHWDGIDEPMLAKVNIALSELGYAPKLLPSSYILQLAEMGVRNPVCSLLRSKAGISVYRVESEGKRLVLKVYDKPEDAREIDNYLLLKKLHIPTLPILGYTKNAILLPEVDTCAECRPSTETDAEKSACTDNGSGYCLNINADTEYCLDTEYHQDRKPTTGYRLGIENFYNSKNKRTKIISNIIIYFSQYIGLRHPYHYFPL